MLQIISPIIARTVSDCTHGFFGLVPWYEFLKDRIDPATCDFRHDGFTLLPKGGHSDVALVLAAVVDDLIRIAGFMAIVFVIVGAIRYIYSQGDPEGTAQAQSTIINALIGLVVAIIAVAFISFLGNKIGT